MLYYLLMADEVFEEWVMNPTLHTMMDYLMHGQQQLSSLTSFIKWNGGSYGEGLGLHSDCPPGRDGALPPSSDVANAAYCLTDYTLENGALAIVPGSHRKCRHPVPGEGVKEAVPVEGPAGSLIVWHGNVWHGAFPKTTDGLRMNVTSYHCQKRLKTQEAYQWRVTEEMLEVIRRSSRVWSRPTTPWVGTRQALRNAARRRGPQQKARENVWGEGRLVWRVSGLRPGTELSSSLLDLFDSDVTEMFDEVCLSMQAIRNGRPAVFTSAEIRGPGSIETPCGTPPGGAAHLYQQKKPVQCLHVDLGAFSYLLECHFFETQLKNEFFSSPYSNACRVFSLRFSRSG